MPICQQSLISIVLVLLCEISMALLLRNRPKGFIRSKLYLSSNVEKKYDHLKIEQKWQKHWDENSSFKSTRRPGKEKKYVLDMFPYPSGSGLHVGHPEGYTATDIMSRYWRMKDFDVLHPMGWDAFGLPAEQHAINTGTHPAVTTNQNIQTFKRQLKSLGFSYDWSRELATTDDGYVKWTQWIFLQLFKAGLAKQSEINVNWCPALGTVLANEEVINGLSERGNHPVVRQPVRQWVLKITEYADKLEDGLDALQWPEGTLTAQKQWIGRSVGASIRFNVNTDAETRDGQCIEVFTTRPDTIMGVTYLVLAPENPLVASLTTDAQKNDVAAYVTEVMSKSDLQRTGTGKDKGKTGVWTGSYAVHPLSGALLPIWIADYVLGSYGTGAVMAVPAHDERDFQFAKQFGLDIKAVVRSAKSVSEGGGEGGVGSDGEGEESALPMVSPGVVCNSGADLDGLPTDSAVAKVITKLSDVGAGGAKITYKLRDWVFSRQRYWGEPIPVYFPVEMEDPSSGLSPAEGAPHKILFDEPIAVDEAELPLRLPDMSDFHPGSDPAGCLSRAKDWRYFQRDGRWWARETNTMPQWAGSCWYYLRFTDPTNTQALMSKEAASWLPVDLYVGGQEHAVLHLLYARFWHKVLFDIGVVDHPEPFLKLVHQGMILGSDGEKMSKSRGNVINPDDVVNEFGADALRLYEMFMGPLEAVKPWQTSQLAGVVRFRDRVMALLDRKISSAEPTGGVLGDMHKTIKKVTEDIDRMSFNTAISSLMIFSNKLSSLEGDLPIKAVEALILLVSPFAPHMAEEAWERLGHATSLGKEPWPTYDASLCQDSTAVVAIQVSGKVRAKIEMGLDLSQEDAMSLAVANPSVAKYTSDASVKSIVYIPGKILNIVLNKSK